MLDYGLLVIGSGFGGTMTALTVARALRNQGSGERVLILERGTWWTTPHSTVQDKEVGTYAFLAEKQGQPVQFWSSVDHFKGVADIMLRCVRRPNNEDGLYELTTFGSRNAFGFLTESDGVSILRASGVGGGSLVYSNITMAPPKALFTDPRWPRLTETPGRTLADYYALARDAIGFGVTFALDKRDAVTGDQAATPVNAGLQNISTRSAGLVPHWDTASGVKRIVPSPVGGGSARTANPDPQNAFWLDRARVFQTALHALAADSAGGGPYEWGTVDSSINDLAPGVTDVAPVNVCERHGRCNVGCLPGARHTLNKQLMRAMYGTPNGAVKPELPNLALRALTEVRWIRARAGGGYDVIVLERDPRDPSRTTERVISATRVVLAAGCVGSAEILLRSQQKAAESSGADGLPGLSAALGDGFSTNGDYIAFLDGTRQQVNLTRGPVTTSFGHFGDPADVRTFHTVEDQGIPKAFCSLTGFGVPLLRSFASGRARQPRLFLLFALVLRVLARGLDYVRSFFRNYRERQDVFRSEEEVTAKMMCVVAQGMEASIGRFRLGSGNETPLRLSRPDGPFHADPVYDRIRATLKRLVPHFSADPTREFMNPFLTETADALKAKSIALSHPLGGVRMAASPDVGPVDEYGRVYDVRRQDGRRCHEGLYVADASIIPTALGVNPSLTISVLALRIADQIVAEWAMTAGGFPAVVTDAQRVAGTTSPPPVTP